MNPYLLLLTGMAVVIVLILGVRLHAFLSLLIAALLVAWLTPGDLILQYGLSRGMSESAARQLVTGFFADRVAEGFGRTVGQIGLMIAMASIIGEGMLRSGAADRIVRTTLRLVGAERAPRAFVASGFLLGIPVFFDTVFYLVIPLIKAVRLRSGRHYLWYILALIAGGSITHSLVPPTPGPLFVAAEFRIGMATMIGMGCFIGVFCSAAGYLFAKWADRRWDLPLRETPDSLARMVELSERDESALPATWLALLPVILPVLLIALAALWPLPVMKALGDKNIALMIGAALAMWLLHRWGPREDFEVGVREALVGAGGIMLITGAGGAFGTVLQQTHIGGMIERLQATSAILPVAFLLTAAIRSSSGSATVAMITTAGAFSAMARPEILGFHPVYLAMAIGCGSKPVSWLNDSAFWIMTRMSGMTEREGLKTISPLMLVMGVVGIVVTMIMARLFPLI
ncbi:MAG: GntP family permease [Blastocatellia bacterium]|jgi:GntP family gluconate:H+ symporter